MKRMILAEFREIYDQLGREEISMSKAVELINQGFQAEPSIDSIESNYRNPDIDRLKEAVEAKRDELVERCSNCRHKAIHEDSQPCVDCIYTLGEYNKFEPTEPAPALSKTETPEPKRYFFFSYTYFADDKLIGRGNIVCKTKKFPNTGKLNELMVNEVKIAYPGKYSTIGTVIDNWIEMSKADYESYCNSKPLEAEK